MPMTISANSPAQVHEDFEATAATMDGFAAIYKMLACAYRKEPDGSFIGELRGTRFPANTGNDRMDKGYLGIASYLSKVGMAAQGELAADYSRTFIGGGTDSYSAAYPFESVHVARRRLMMQDSRDEVLAIYRAYNLEPNGAVKTGEDHIAYELEFMQVMCERCAKALRSGDDALAESVAKAQLNFLNDHLLNWVGKLTAQMRHFSKTEFYHGVSYLTIGSLREHAAFLEEMLG